MKRFAPLFPAMLMAVLAAPTLAGQTTDPVAEKEKTSETAPAPDATAPVTPAPVTTTPATTTSPAPPAAKLPVVAVPPPVTLMPPPSPFYAPGSNLDMKLIGKTAIHVNGSISSGATARLRTMLTRNTEVKTIILSSPGGQVIEGMGMRALIAKKKLATHVEVICASACTLAYLGGVDRSLAPTAQIGFHRSFRATPAFLVKADPEGDQLSNEAVRQSYIQSGLAQNIIDRALATPSEDMWFPDARELLTGRFATRITTKREHELKAGDWDSFDELEASVATEPLWQALKRTKRSYYLRGVTALWLEAGLNRSKERARTTANEMLGQLLLADMRKYPVELIDRFIQSENKAWGEAKNTFNARCSLSGDSMPLSQPVTPEQIAAQQAVLVAMAETPVPDGAIDEATRKAALVDMWQLWALMLADSAADSSDVIRGFCREPGRYYKMLAGLDGAARVKLFRSIATVQSADARAQF